MIPEPLPVMANGPVVLAVPKLAKVEKRFVLDAVVEKKLVVVAEVPVALTKVKFWRVVELLTKSVPFPMPEFKGVSLRQSIVMSTVRT